MQVGITVPVLFLIKQTFPGVLSVTTYVKKCLGIAASECWRRRSAAVVPELRPSRSVEWSGSDRDEADNSANSIQEAGDPDVFGEA